MALFLVLEDYTDGRVTLAASDIVSDTELDLVALRRAGLVDAPYATTMDPTIEAFQNRRRQDPVTQNDLLSLMLRSNQGAGIVGTSTGQNVEQRLTAMAGDEKVKITAADTTADFLSPKLVAGTGITLTVVAPGANEKISIAAPGSTTDEKVKVTAADTTPGFLDDKLVAGAGLTRTVVTPGGDEDYQLDIVANADASIVVNANDIQVGVLASDAQHGARGGGTQHAAATIAVNGFMSAADKTKLDSLTTGGISATLAWGASMGAGDTGKHFGTWDNGNKTAALSGVNQIASPIAGTIRRLFWSTDAADATTVFKINVNGLVVQTVTLTGQDGSSTLSTTVVAQGDLIAIEFDAGTAPTETNTGVIIV